MKEKDFQTLFSRKNAISGVFELKLTKTKSLAYSKVEPHQIKSLLAANTEKGCAFKISDMSMEKKPFDSFLIANYPAYIVILYYVQRKPKIAYYIPIKSFVAEVGPGQGLSEAQAKELAEYTITL